MLLKYLIEGMDGIINQHYLFCNFGIDHDPWCFDFGNTWIFQQCWPHTGLMFQRMRTPDNITVFILNFHLFCSTLYDVCTSLSRIPSAIVSPPFTAYQFETGNRLTMTVDDVPCLSSIISLNPVVVALQGKLAKIIND